MYVCLSTYANEQQTSSIRTSYTQDKYLSKKVLFGWSGGTSLLNNYAEW